MDVTIDGAVEQKQTLDVDTIIKIASPEEPHLPASLRGGLVDRRPVGRASRSAS